MVRVEFMDLISSSRSLFSSELIFFRVVLPIACAIYFSRVIRSGDPMRFRNFTSVMIIMAVVLVSLDFVGALLSTMLNVHFLYLGYLSPIGLWCPYLWYLPFFCFMVCAVLFYVRKKFYPGAIVLAIWCTIVVFQLATVISCIAAVMAWTPPAYSPSLNEFDRFLQEAMHISRERILINTILPFYWLVLSAYAAYRAFLYRNVQ
jgi:hypothetical protein